jgi:hypothetical protein
MCILRDAKVKCCVNGVVTYDNLDSIKFSLIEKNVHQSGMCT